MPMEDAGSKEFKAQPASRMDSLHSPENIQKSQSQGGKGMIVVDHYSPALDKRLDSELGDDILIEANNISGFHK